MKTLKITTYWTTEEADCIYQLLDEFKSVIWQHYGEDIMKIHKDIASQQQHEQSDDFDDNIPF
jgi:hypothetical protein